MAKGKPGSVDLDGNVVSFTNRWPHPAIMNAASCADLRDTALRGAEPVQPYAAGVPAPAWSTLGIGINCIFIYHEGEVYSGANLLPLILYRPVNGAPQILRFNM